MLGTLQIISNSFISSFKVCHWLIGSLLSPVELIWRSISSSKTVPNLFRDLSWRLEVAISHLVRLRNGSMLFRFALYTVLVEGSGNLWNLTRLHKVVVEDRILIILQAMIVRLDTSIVWVHRGNSLCTNSFQSFFAQVIKLGLTLSIGVWILRPKFLFPKVALLN